MASTSRNDLLPAETRWTHVEHHDEVDSTNRVAADAARDGAPPGLVVLSDHQTAGRGRHGRVWEDEPGGSLLLSALVDGSGFESSLAPLAAGLAVRDALLAYDTDVEVKWPNDLLAGGAKVAGILAESVADAPQGVRLVVGIGVNVDWRRRDHGEDRTSVAEVVGGAVERFALLTGLLRALDARLREAEDAPEELRDAYRASCATIGRDVRVVLPAGEVEGRAEDVNARGALVVRGPDGTATVVEAGDVTYVRRPL